MSYTLKTEVSGFTRQQNTGTRGHRGIRQANGPRSACRREQGREEGGEAAGGPGGPPPTALAGGPGGPPPTALGGGPGSALQHTHQLGGRSKFEG